MHLVHPIIGYGSAWEDAKDRIKFPIKAELLCHQTSCFSCHVRVAIMHSANFGLFQSTTWLRYWILLQGVDQAAMTDELDPLILFSSSEYTTSTALAEEIPQRVHKFQMFAYNSAHHRVWSSAVFGPRGSASLSISVIITVRCPSYTVVIVNYMVSEQAFPCHNWPYRWYSSVYVWLSLRHVYDTWRELIMLVSKPSTVQHQC